MPARAWSTTRSAAAICSSSARTSGSNAFSRASQLATATSFSCNDSNASRSGCTLPPCRLNDSVRRPLRVALGGEAHLVLRQGGLLGFGGKRDRAIDPLDLAVEAPRLEPVHGALEHDVRLFGAKPLGLQRLVGTGRRFVETIGRVIGERLEQRAIGRELEFLGVDGFDDASPPRLARHHEEQERFLGVGRQGGRRRQRAVESGRRLLLRVHFLLQHVLANPRYLRYAL